MLKRRVASFGAATVFLSATMVGLFAAPAFALPHATGNITCTMSTSTTSVGSITKGLSTGGLFYPKVTVKFTVGFTCVAPAPVTATPAGDVVTGGTLKGKAVYVSPNTGTPANLCTDFTTGLDNLKLAVVKINWTASTPIAPTRLVYALLGPGTVGGGVITLGPTPPGAGVRLGSFAGANAPDTLKIGTNGFGCAAATPPHTFFVITGGSINV
ncbi:MAG TPA: hypothetical protein VK428_13785 [Acidimicrobiales bacterium]|nr:hypothetical protein [Acidimicrobiales bacterium]